MAVASSLMAASWDRAVRQLAAKYGCVPTRLANNHYALRHPSGWYVVCSSSPRSPERETRNVEAMLRRFSRTAPQRGH